MKIIPIAFTSQEVSELASVLDLAASRLPRPWVLGDAADPGDFHIISVDQPAEFSRHLQNLPPFDFRRIIAYVPEDATVEAHWILRKRLGSPPRMSEIWALLANIERYLQEAGTETAEAASSEAEATGLTDTDGPVREENSSTKTSESPVVAEDAVPSATAVGDQQPEEVLADWDGVSTIALMPSASLSFTEDEASETPEPHQAAVPAEFRPVPSKTPMAAENEPSVATAATAKPDPALDASEESQSSGEDELAEWDGLSTIALMPSSSLAFEPETVASQPAPSAAEHRAPPAVAEATVPEAVPERAAAPAEAAGSGDAPRDDEKSSILHGIGFAQIQRRDWQKTALVPNSPSARESFPEQLHQALKDQTARLFFINDKHVIMVSPREGNCHFRSDLKSTLRLFRTYPDRIKTKVLTLKHVQAYLHKYGFDSAPLSEVLWLAAMVDSRAALLSDVSPDTAVRLASAAVLETLPYFEEFALLAEIWRSNFLSLQQASDGAGEPMGKTVAFYNAGTLLGLFEPKPQADEAAKPELQNAQSVSGKAAAPSLLQKIGGVFKSKWPD